MKAKTVTAGLITVIVGSGCQPDLVPAILEPELGKPGLDCTVPEPHPSCKDDSSSGGEDTSHTVALETGMEMPAVAAEVRGPKGKLGTTTIEGGGTAVDLDMNLTNTLAGACVLSISEDIPAGMHDAIEVELETTLIGYFGNPQDLSFVIDLDAALAEANSSVHEIHVIGPGGAGGEGIWVRVGHNNEAAQDPPVEFVTVGYSDNDDDTPDDESIVDPTATRVFTFLANRGGLVRSITRVDVDGNGLRGNDPTAGLRCELRDNIVLTVAPST